VRPQKEKIMQKHPVAIAMLVIQKHPQEILNGTE